MFSVASLLAVGSALWRVPELRRRWLVGAIDGRRLPSDCALAPQRNSTREEISAEGKSPTMRPGGELVYTSGLLLGEWASMGFAAALDELLLVQLLSTLPDGQKKMRPVVEHENVA